MKSTLLLMIFMLSFAALSGEEVAVVTVPKSGTHLIKKLLQLVDASGAYPVYHTDEFYESKALRTRYPRRILLVRDPRDVVVSWVRYIAGGQADQVDRNIRELPRESRRHWEALSWDRQVEYVIRGNSRQSQQGGVHPTLIYFPLSPYEVALHFKEEPGTLVCKFENLIGPEGGGSRSRQREEVCSLLNFLGIEISDARLEEVLGELFGGTQTFRKGKIGAWKESFSRANRKLFMKRRSHLLSAFGY